MRKMSALQLVLVVSSIFFILGGVIGYSMEEKYWKKTLTEYELSIKSANKASEDAMYARIIYSGCGEWVVTDSATGATSFHWKMK